MHLPTAELALVIELGVRAPLELTITMVLAVLESPLVSVAITPDYPTLAMKYVCDELSLVYRLCSLPWSSPNKFPISVHA